MSDIRLDPTTWDIQLVNGDLNLIDKKDAVGQNLQQALQLFYQEWFLDTSRGIPYYQIIFKKNPNINTIDGILKNTILSVAGVDELLAFNLLFDSSTRELQLSYSVRVEDTTLDFTTILGAANTGA